MKWIRGNFFSNLNQTILKEKIGLNDHTQLLRNQLIMKTNFLAADKPCAKFSTFSKLNVLQSICIPEPSKTNLLFTNNNKELNNNENKRMYSGLTGPTPPPPKPTAFPTLMYEFPGIAWPHIIKSIRNWILTRLIIKPYFDREFNTDDFIEGAKQAVVHVSNSLSKGEIDSLENVLAPLAFEEIKGNICDYNVQQRSELLFKKEDIFFTFPYEVGIIFDEDEERDKEAPQRRFVEITVVYHILRGLEEVKNLPEAQNFMSLIKSKELQDRILIINFRFLREFTKGIKDDWIVNFVNYYKPIDFIQ